MTELRLATLADIGRCVEILSSGRAFQREQGFVQWEDGYPGIADVEADIQNGTAYVVSCGGEIAAYLHIGLQGDPAYGDIQGAWHSDAPYAVLHRIAIGSDFRGKGFAHEVFSLAESFCKTKGFLNLRIDTHEDNQRMQHILKKNGFSYCGIVMQQGPRMAFDKVLF